jgi:hypothetical protein
MQNDQKQIIELITENILNEVLGVDPNSLEFDFMVEKILINCGLEEKYVFELINTLKKSLNETKNYNNIFIKKEISNFVDIVFEEKRQVDKIAVRNKQSGAIQLVSKKTYQANSQIYTPLSAGWAKANVIMVRNKTSGEEYPILLKNFDSNKHEKVGTGRPPEEKEKEAPLQAKPAVPVPNRKDKKQKDAELPKKSKDTVRPIMIEPSLKAKTMTAFILPKDISKQQTPPEFPEKESDIISKVNQSIKDKKLNKNLPLERPSFKYAGDDGDYEIYDKLGDSGLLPPGFNLNKRYTIPNSLTNKIKIPRGYVTIIEQLINTINGENTTIGSYSIPFAIKTNPNAKLSLFELILLYSVCLDNEDFSKFSISIETFINSGIESNLTKELWDSVIAERKLIINYLIKKYSSIYTIVAGAWKTEDHQLDLGIDDSEIDMDKVSDIFLRIKNEEGSDILEEFLVTPNRSTLIYLDKPQFVKYIKVKKENIKAKLLMFILKMFPLQRILEGNIAVVFPNVIYDNITLIELFKTQSVDNLELKLKHADKQIHLMYKLEEQYKNIISIMIDDIINLKIDDAFEKDCITINNKIYKID